MITNTDKTHLDRLPSSLTVIGAFFCLFALTVVCLLVQVWGESAYRQSLFSELKSSVLLHEADQNQSDILLTNILNSSEARLTKVLNTNFNHSNYTFLLREQENIHRLNKVIALLEADDFNQAYNEYETYLSNQSIFLSQKKQKNSKALTLSDLELSIQGSLLSLDRFSQNLINFKNQESELGHKVESLTDQFNLLRSDLADFFNLKLDPANEQDFSTYQSGLLQGLPQIIGIADGFDDIEKLTKQFDLIGGYSEFKSTQLNTELMALVSRIKDQSLSVSNELINYDAELTKIEDTIEQTTTESLNLKSKAIQNNKKLLLNSLGNLLSEISFEENILKVLTLYSWD